MTGQKLELYKETLSLLLRELSSKDRFGLVVFGSNARLEIPPRKLTKANKEAALAKIKSLGAGGSTNLSGGLGLAAQELHQVENPHDVRTIFLLTDGHANQGISSRDGVVSLAKSLLRAQTGEKTNNISIHCFGYGLDHNSDMLGDVAQATEGGSYYFVNSDTDISAAFGEALGGILSVLAQNTVVKIDIPEEAKALGVSILDVKHDKAEKQSDGSFTVPLGDFYEDESRDVVIKTTLSKSRKSSLKEEDETELHLPHIPHVPHIAVSLKYLDTINKKLVNSPSILGSIMRPEGTFVSKVNVHVALQCIRVRATNTINEARSIAETSRQYGGNLQEARTKINDFIQEVKKEAEKLEALSDLFIIQLLAELNGILEGLSSISEYETRGAKVMKSSAMQYEAQRCAQASVDVDVPNMYRTKKRASMMSKMSQR
eukprot:CAMPEP_0178966870 /NCGR_PEP_ID=MMETSP0789-20121207/17182_1 /TAXON_ID=3005 /ORGANISM="Rhizosolenia setigera, Strain CCMP 1694" /LENGTH=430 /DNA_ID=CAMNT_0020652223 /DNA_START=154 /DNA_END=1446 /DNA_ORIENTATION=+